jgi:predicted RNA binding protein YcfA (HicA-like mRNA interferase family)
MPKPVSRKEFIRRFRALGWDGPHGGGPHMTMSKSGRRISVPNPHRGDIDWSLTKRALKKAGIDPQDWDALD